MARTPQSIGRVIRPRTSGLEATPEIGQLSWQSGQGPAVQRYALRIDDATKQTITAGDVIVTTARNDPCARRNRKTLGEWLDDAFVAPKANDLTGHKSTIGLRNPDGGADGIREGGGFEKLAFACGQ